MTDYYGHLTHKDGSHTPLSEDEAEALWLTSKQEQADRAEQMPDTRAALSVICTGKERLRELGWRGGVYCPKDGTPFACIEFGSTGIFTASYSGDWPNGHLICEDFVIGVHGIMWKAIEDLTDEEQAARQRSCEDTIQFNERMFEMFSATDHDDTTQPETGEYE